MGGDPSSFDEGTSAGGGHSPRPRDNTNNTGDGGRSEIGGLSPRSPLTRSQGLPGGGSAGGGGEGGTSSGGVGGNAAGLVGQSGVRPRGVELTAVTFAANAPVMAVGKRGWWASPCRPCCLHTPGVLSSLDGAVRGGGFLLLDRRLCELERIGRGVCLLFR